MSSSLVQPLLQSLVLSLWVYVSDGGVSSGLTTRSSPSRDNRAKHQVGSTLVQRSTFGVDGNSIDQPSSPTTILSWGERLAQILRSYSLEARYFTSTQKLETGLLSSDFVTTRSYMCSASCSEMVLAPRTMHLPEYFNTNLPARVELRWWYLHTTRYVGRTSRLEIVHSWHREPASVQSLYYVVTCGDPTSSISILRPCVDRFWFWKRIYSKLIGCFRAMVQPLHDLYFGGLIELVFQLCFSCFASF